MPSPEQPWYAAWRAKIQECVARMEDDEEVPFAHLSSYAEWLPRAVVRALDGQGHEFRRRDTPELIRDIQSVAAGVTPSTRSNR